MLTLGSTYLRIAPNGDKSFVDIDTQNIKEYHESLEVEGYVYQEQHVVSPQICLSCEG